MASPSSILAAVMAQHDADLGTRTLAVSDTSGTVTYGAAVEVRAPFQYHVFGDLRVGTRAFIGAELADGVPSFADARFLGETRGFFPDNPEVTAYVGAGVDFSQFPDLGEVNWETDRELLFEHHLPPTAAGSTQFLIESVEYDLVTQTVLGTTEYWSPTVQVGELQTEAATINTSTTARFETLGGSVGHHVDLTQNQVFRIHRTDAEIPSTGIFMPVISWLFTPDSVLLSGGVGSDPTVFYAPEAGRWVTLSDIRLGELRQQLDADLAELRALAQVFDGADFTYEIEVMDVSPVPIAATPVTGALSSAFASDYYSVTLAEGQALDVAVTDGPVDTCAPGGTVEVGVQIWDPLGRPYDGAGGPCPSFQSPAAPTSGTYVIRAHQACAGACGPFEYTITVTVVDP